MHKLLSVSADSPLLYQLSLTDAEVEAILEGRERAEARFGRRVALTQRRRLTAGSASAVEAPVAGNGDVAASRNKSR